MGVGEKKTNRIQNLLPESNCRNDLSLGVPESRVRPRLVQLTGGRVLPGRQTQGRGVEQRNRTTNTSCYGANPSKCDQLSTFTGPFPPKLSTLHRSIFHLVRESRVNVLTTFHLSQIKTGPRGYNSSPTIPATYAWVPDTVLQGSTAGHRQKALGLEPRGSQIVPVCSWLEPTKPSL